LDELGVVRAASVLEVFDRGFGDMDPLGELFLRQLELQPDAGHLVAERARIRLGRRWLVSIELLRELILTRLSIDKILLAWILGRRVGFWLLLEYDVHMILMSIGLFYHVILLIPNILSIINFFFHRTMMASPYPNKKRLMYKRNRIARKESTKFNR